MAAKHPRVEVWRLDNGKWFWHFEAVNSRVVADAAEAYHRRWHCLNGAAAALGLPKSITSLKAGEQKVVRRSGGAVLVVVEGGDSRG